MESEEKELKERMIVLEEQRFMVRQMMEEARKKRRFDEVAALRGNLEEVEREISGVEGEIGGLDWGGGYRSGEGSGSGGGGGEEAGLRGWMGWGMRR